MDAGGRAIILTWGERGRKRTNMSLHAYSSRKRPKGIRSAMLRAGHRVREHGSPARDQTSVPVSRKPGHVAHGLPRSLEETRPGESCRSHSISDAFTFIYTVNPSRCSVLVIFIGHVRQAAPLVVTVLWCRTDIVLGRGHRVTLAASSVKSVIRSHERSSSISPLGNCWERQRILTEPKAADESLPLSAAKPGNASNFALPETASI